MTELTIFERTGFTDRTEVDQLVEQFERDNWTAEVIKEDDGTFTLRAFPPEFGARAPANNPNTGAAEAISPGPPVTAATSGIKALLDFISKFESDGNYNAFFGDAGNENNPRLTDMTLADVVAWQRAQTEERRVESSAAGRYQIIRSTLEGLIASLGLDRETEQFSPDVQDRMGTKLLEERGLLRYKAQQMTPEDFANQVARVWAALPVVTDVTKGDGSIARKGFSYYAGVGSNKALVGVESYLETVTRVVA